MRATLIAVGAIGSAIVMAAPAYAVRQCKPGKTDSRVCTVAYDPDDVIEVWGAVGAPLTIDVGADEAIMPEGVKVSDHEHIVAAFVPEGHLISLKFIGCVVPEPMPVFTHKGAVDRTILFQVETIPTTCVTPDMQPKDKQQAVPEFVKASLAEDAASPVNLKYLPDHDPNALAAGSKIPYLVRVTYPADAAAAAAAVRRSAARSFKSQEAQNLLKAAAQAGTDFSKHRQNLYYWNGDLSLKPASITDDGYTTTLYWPANQEIPNASAPGNPAAHCGPQAQEVTKDIFTYGSTTTVTGTFQSLCLRSSNNRVLEVWNAAYSPVGRLPGTGTVLDNVIREVKGANDGR